MARINFTVDFSQGTTGMGQITFTIGGEAFVVEADRLDVVGARTMRMIPQDEFKGDIRVECIRTSNSDMRVVVIFSREVATQYGTPFSLERVIENVPLNFTP